MKKNPIFHNKVTVFDIANNNIVQNFGVSKTLKKYIVLYSKDSLNCLKVTNNVLMLQKISI